MTIARRVEFEQTVKSSRFICWATPIESETDALELLSEARQQHPTATHHCSAWRVGESVRFSDDGEPGGTAGRPMLEVILKRDLQNVATVVIRYFGGTRLGAGGLVRAYSGSVAKALDSAGTRTVLEQGSLEAIVPFPLVDSVLRYVADESGLRTLSSEYGPDGLRLQVEMPVGRLLEFRSRLVDHTRGEITILD